MIRQRQRHRQLLQLLPRRSHLHARRKLPRPRRRRNLRRRQRQLLRRVDVVIVFAAFELRPFLTRFLLCMRIRVWIESIKFPNRWTESTRSPVPVMRLTPTSLIPESRMPMLIVVVVLFMQLVIFIIVRCLFVAGTTNTVLIISSIILERTHPTRTSPINLLTVTVF